MAKQYAPPNSPPPNYPQQPQASYGGPVSERGDYYNQPQYYGGQPQGGYYGPPQGGYYNQPGGMYYQQQPYGYGGGPGYYADRGYGGRGGGDTLMTGLCAGLCASLCCLDMCLFF